MSHKAQHSLKMLPNIVGRFLLIVAGLLLPLLLLEIGVRLLDLAPPPEPNPAIWNLGVEWRRRVMGLKPSLMFEDSPEPAIRTLDLGA